MLIPRKVYAIQHNVTKRMYIGSSGKLKERLANHLSLLRNGKHSIEDMQKDFNEYGQDYTVTLLDEINSLDESDKEYEWMEKYKTRIRGIGYNYKDHTAKKVKQNDQ